MNLFAEISRRIAQRKKEITDKEFFLRREFSQHCDKMISSLLKIIFFRIGKRKIPNINLHIIYDPEDTMLAKTNGTSIIWVNTDSCAAQKCNSLSEKFDVAMGLIFHELSHVLFMETKRWNDFLYKYEIYGNIPDLDFSDCSSDIQKGFDEFRVASKNRKLRSTFSDFAADIVNILNDAVDEYLIGAFASGYYNRCLKTLNDLLFSDTKTVKDEVLDSMDELSKLGSEGKSLEYIEISRHMCNIRIVLNQVVLYSVYYKINLGEYEGILKGIIEDEVKVIDQYRYNNHFEDLLKCTFLIILTMWDLFRPIVEIVERKKEDDELKEALSKTSSSAKSSQMDRDCQGTAQVNEEDLSGQLDTLQQQQHRLENRHTSTTNESKSLFGNTKTENHGNNGSAESVDFCQLLAACAKTDVLKDLEAAKTAELNREADQFTEKSIKSHAGLKYEIIRTALPSYSDQNDYNNLVAEFRLDMVAKKCSKKLEQVLQDRIMNSKQSGLYMGRFDGRRCTRQDSACFYRNKLPGTLDVAVAVMMDESGSMNGDERIEHLKRMAIVLDSFASNLNLPCLMYGHTTPEMLDCYYPVYLYRDFEQIDRMDKFRLMSITARRCNRDGFLMMYGIKKLMQRPETVKLLFVISDGLPNDMNINGRYAGEDMSEVITFGRKAGIKIIGAAIGADRQRIEAFYGKNFFLNIEDLEKMPQNIINIIKAYISI